MSSPLPVSTIDLARDKIVLASSNAHKIQEFKSLLPEAEQLIGQDALKVPSPEETGQTFIENALLKARHASLLTGLPALADDSGLVVPALNGAPGIFSARYAGPTASDTENCNRLLSALSGVTDRRACFHASLVFLLHADDPDPIIAQGHWFGEILTQSQGTNGFGYDPLFLVPELKKTAAELPESEKSAISHRGQALRRLIDSLAARYPQ
jgi:XTP/dITP diphosphohydrolase